MSLDLGRIWRRIQHMVRPGRTSAAANEGGPIQRVQVRINEFETREMNAMQLFGFVSSPKPGCDVLIANIGGDNANGDVIASNDQRYRPRGLSAGSVRIYNDSGSYIHVEGGQITIVAASKVTITTPEVTISGKLTVQGDIVSTGGDVTAGTVSLKHHHHSGVQAGAAQTGEPVP